MAAGTGERPAGVVVGVRTGHVMAGHGVGRLAGAPAILVAAQRLAHVRAVREVLSRLADADPVRAEARGTVALLLLLRLRLRRRVPGGVFEQAVAAESASDRVHAAGAGAVIAGEPVLRDARTAVVCHVVALISRRRVHV